MKAYLIRLANIFTFGDTRPTRLWLALIDFAFAYYTYQEFDSSSFTGMMMMFGETVGPYQAGYLWAGAFAAHGLYLMRGMTGQYSAFTLMIEGVFGWCIWTTTAITHTAAQGFPGPTLIAALMMTWILIRYPTHWTRWGPRDDA